MPLDPQKLRALRARAKLSQRDLAELLGIAQPQVADWERGKKGNVKIDTLLKISDALMVPIADLISDD